jgi:hypothetical protein
MIECWPHQVSPQALIPGKLYVMTRQINCWLMFSSLQQLDPEHKIRNFLSESSIPPEKLATLLSPLSPYNRGRGAVQPNSHLMPPPGLRILNNLESGPSAPPADTWTDPNRIELTSSTTLLENSSSNQSLENNSGLRRSGREKGKPSGPFSETISPATHKKSKQKTKKVVPQPSEVNLIGLDVCS